jgi:glutamate-5-semialdehyde dehydrogenase
MTTPVANEASRLREEVARIARQAREAARHLAQTSADRKNAALRAMASALRAHEAQILSANREDVEQARRDGLSSALVDRLMLNERRLAEMVASIQAVEALPDPVGTVIRAWERPNGLKISKVRVPLGVIGIIYESRPNVTSECASLCLKSGNAVVLRGGAEAFRSNHAIGAALREALRAGGLPEGAVGVVPTPSREGVEALLELKGLIDVLIPRGGAALIRMITERSRIPVIKHAKGVCHVYVDEAADLDMALAITLNAKCQRPATCNAMETLLVHEGVAATFVPKALARLKEAGVEVRGCPRTLALLPRVGGLKAATEEDWGTEYLDLILSVKVVSSLEEAVEHIRRYGSAHSDAIVTRETSHAARFTDAVDSAAVYVNASTRFTDGFQFGLGAEIGISTDRLHARGPMGLEELTTYKYVVQGQGHLRE